MINASKDRTAAKLYGGSERGKGKWKRGKGEDNRVAKICAKVTVLDLYQIYQTASPDFPFSTRTASRHFNAIEAIRRCQDWCQTSVSIRYVAPFHAYFCDLEIGRHHAKMPRLAVPPRCILQMQSTLFALRKCTGFTALWCIPGSIYFPILKNRGSS
jgi:hypothetical protein